MWDVAKWHEKNPEVEEEAEDSGGGEQWLEENGYPTVTEDVKQENVRAQDDVNTDLTVKALKRDCDQNHSTGEQFPNAPIPNFGYNGDETYKSYEPPGYIPDAGDEVDEDEQMWLDGKREIWPANWSGEDRYHSSIYVNPGDQWERDGGEEALE